MEETAKIPEVAWISTNASNKPTWHCTKPSDSTKERSLSTITTVPSNIRNLRLGAAGKCEEDENHIKRNNQRNNYHIDREFHRTIHIVAH